MSQMAEFLSFSWLDNIPLMRTTSVFIHLLIDPWVVSISWLLWIMLQWTWWYRYLFKILFSFFWLHTLEWNCWYYGSSTFNFLRNFYAAFHNGCTNLHSHHRCTRVPILHIFINTSYLLSFDFSQSNNCEVISQYGFDISLMSLIISDVEYLSMYLLVICISSLEKYIFSFFTHFKIRLFNFLVIELCWFLIYFEN